MRVPILRGRLLPDGCLSVTLPCADNSVTRGYVSDPARHRGGAAAVDRVEGWL